jgi:alpha-tubulin suppressor-like RCC1 family protein
MQRADGRLKCWGANDWGQLGLGTSRASVGLNASDMGDGLPFVDVGAGVRVTQVAMSSAHTCVVTDAKQVKCECLMERAAPA